MDNSSQAYLRHFAAIYKNSSILANPAMAAKILQAFTALCYSHLFIYKLFMCKYN